MVYLYKNIKTNTTTTVCGIAGVLHAITVNKTGRYAIQWMANFEETGLARTTLMSALRLDGTTEYLCDSIWPMLAAAIPFPRPESTPPVTKINFFSNGAILN